MPQIMNPGSAGRGAQAEIGGELGEGAVGAAGVQHRADGWKRRTGSLPGWGIAGRGRPHTTAALLRVGAQELGMSGCALTCRAAGLPRPQGRPALFLVPDP